MAWGEFVHITARYFDAGERPWGPNDFYANSVPQAEAPATTDPIVLTIWEHDGPRVAENSNWWEQLGHLWWTANGTAIENVALDEQHRLPIDAVRFEFNVLPIGGADNDYQPPGLLIYEMNGVGLCDMFLPAANEIKTLCDQHRKPGKVVVFLLSLWQCEAGWQYIPGEPSEYDTDWQLMGAVLPQTEGATFERLLEAA